MSLLRTLILPYDAMCIVMGMAVTRDNALAASVSADHLVCRYNLFNAPGDALEHPAPLATKHPGNGAVAFRSDGRVLATAGWDGAIRLYSTGRRHSEKVLSVIAEGKERARNTDGIIDPQRKMRPLGTLEYFKESCFALAFANEVLDKEDAERLLWSQTVGGIHSDGKEEDETQPFSRVNARSRWLAVGGKNGRVAIWELDSFESPSRTAS
jgi:WD40 repeat protein